MISAQSVITLVIHSYSSTSFEAPYTRCALNVFFILFYFLYVLYVRLYFYFFHTGLVAWYNSNDDDDDDEQKTWTLQNIQTYNT